MRLTTLFLHATVAASALVTREGSNSLPACAQQCLDESLPTSTCSSSDVVCLCDDEQFLASTAVCAAGRCSVVEALAAQNSTKAMCGVPTQSQSSTLIGVAMSFGPLAWFMIGTRLTYRIASNHVRFSWDDVLIGASGLASIGMNVPTVVAANAGFGTDTWAVPPANIVYSLKWMYAAYITFMMGEFLCQLSILAFYLRFLIHPFWRIVNWVLIGIVAAFGLSNTFSMVFYCTPIRLFWEGFKMESPGFCIDIRTFAFVRGAIQIFLDLAILGLPLPTLAKLKMSRERKLNIMSMFCIGFVITIVSCLRLWAFVKFGKTTNPIHDNSAGLYWSIIECNLYQIVACMPIIPGLVRAVKTPFQSTIVASHTGTYGSRSEGHSKRAYVRQENLPEPRSESSLELGGITKYTDFSVHHSDRPETGSELFAERRGVGWSVYGYRG